ncbi:uncharacterized protein STEHIDRAFT_163419 [Stereum hirsutum FP-91666 SS1]|uniref:Ribonuclease H1 N-terminal domain-containing protein n=1 Tax=Stereum hirsutum (strain FP-91666) TaxID=721885 RepID=R7RY92_STEHR|nr:uncharacterized protein STEHIDRAFT_163419 [Stereum hirsutum FP-91666 SS1]EIM79865.1 hypothetical protein STEHIDRAFT_163419 [Stereum hirsutum FP-91666 SS1]
MPQFTASRSFAMLSLTSQVLAFPSEHHIARPADELADELDRNLNVSPRSDAQLRSPRFVRRRADNRGPSILNPTAGHFVVFGARKNGRSAAAAIDGIDRAYYETFSDALSALSATSAASKTGELALGYDYSPTQSALNNANDFPDYSAPTTPLPARAPSALPRSHSFATASHASLYEDNSPDPSVRSSTAPSPHIPHAHSHSKPSLPHARPVPTISAGTSAVLAATQSSVPSPTRATSSPSSSQSITVQATSGVGITYPAPFEGPLPTVPRKIRVSKKNKHYCYAVCIGRRPGLYYTWPETSAQVEGISGGAQRGFPTRVEALAHYHSEGRIGKVKIATE